MKIGAMTARAGRYQKRPLPPSAFCFLPFAFCLLPSVFFLLLPLPSHAATFLTQDEALARAFPTAQIERVGHVLTEPQMATAAKLAGKPIPSALVAAYEARREGRLIGTAYFDAHRVHSKQETLMIVVDPDGQVADVQVLAFTEPAKYLAPEAWLRQFIGRPLDDRLQMKRDIQGITGATLTARATTKAVRRTLAIHAVLNGATNTGH